MVIRDKSRRPNNILLISFTTTGVYLPPREIFNKFKSSSHLIRVRLQHLRYSLILMTRSWFSEWDQWFYRLHTLVTQLQSRAQNTCRNLISRPMNAVISRPPYSSFHYNSSVLSWRVYLAAGKFCHQVLLNIPELYRLYLPHLPWHQ